MMNRLLIKRLFFAFTPVYAPYCPPFAEKNPHLSTTSVGSFQRNKSLAGFVKFASQVKYACGV